MKSLSASVILPVYNDQKNLQACLSALANQTLPHEQFEVIVVDNDSLPAMTLPDLSHLNMTLLHCARPGSYAARNAGLRVASGEVISFLDVDCIPDKRWLESGMEAIREAPRKTLVGGNVKFDFPENPAAIELFQYIRISGQKINIEQKRFSVTANLFARREEIMLVGEFNDSLLSGGDREWCWRAIDQGFEIKFSELTIVTTRFRNTLKASIIRVRRITGGNYQMNTKMNVKNHVSGPGVRIFPVAAPA
jgi:glycosyltransferase involved in cell wall biosynthesis